MVRLPLLRMSKTTAWLLCINLSILLMLLYILDPLITLLAKNDQLFGVQDGLLIPHENRTDGSPHGFTIPKILHQTAATDVIPEKWKKSQQSCLDVYDDFEYMLWTDDGARDFLSEHYPWMVQYWDNYAFPIQRADAIRPFVLYHFGGLYLDMDTMCKSQIPFEDLEAEMEKDLAVFKPTLPTGITNDVMIATARHPAYKKALDRIPLFYKLTRFWAEFQPYCSIMLAAGPLFLTLAVKEYLMVQPSLPSPTVKVINPDELDLFIQDLESSSWHTSDAQVLMWMGQRPWTWYAMGLLFFIPGLILVDMLLLKVYRNLLAPRHTRKLESEEDKLDKLA